VLSAAVLYPNIDLTLPFLLLHRSVPDVLLRW
jgi:hypothetical protein